ncbi:MAG: hypothetical protein RBR81_03645 [Bacteroidales bacterium]|jgi:hypothetical protein|nr:hypothetical protein [Bacteroidales bacterium]
MSIRFFYSSFRALVVILISSNIISCGHSSSGNDLLLLTEIPASFSEPDYLTGVTSRYFPEARISSVVMGKKDSHRILTDDFYSACWPDVSFDGKSMIFTAQKEEGDSWQIWEMNLNNRKYRKITSFKDNCTDPCYLPGGMLAFSKLTVNDTVKCAHCIFTCNLDGTGLRQITYSPGDNYSTTVLKDGRILTVNQQLLPDHGDPMFVVMRPDGTKADLFYMSSSGSKFFSCPRETFDGRIVFIESEKTNPLAGSIVSISYNRPLHSRVELASSLNGDFYSVLPLKSGKYLATGAMLEEELISLYEIDPVNKTAGNVVYADREFNVLEAVMAAPYNRPKKLPSEVDLLVKTGLLLCQDVNFMGIESGMNDPSHPKAAMIEVLGIDSTYGVVPLEDDGSFQLKVLSDKPFRIRSLDADGRVLHGPCTWLWLRPNERRGCVGCHEDPETVPVNRIPLAVKKQPVLIPVNITEIKEKVVELE